MNFIYSSGVLNNSSYCLIRSSGDLVSFSDDSDDDETIIASVTIVVNSEGFEELFGRREDSVMISVNSLLMVGFVSAILVVSEQ